MKILDQDSVTLKKNELHLSTAPGCPLFFILFALFYHVTLKLGISVKQLEQSSRYSATINLKSY